jgi:hypothetical protein
LASLHPQARLRCEEFRGASAESSSLGTVF